RCNPGAGATGPSVPRRSSGRQRSHVRLRDRNAAKNLHLHARPGLPARRGGGSGRTHRAHHLRTARGRIRSRPDPGLRTGLAPAAFQRFHERHRRARRGQTGLTWISGAFCRKFMPVLSVPGFGAHSPRWFFAPVPGLPKDGLPGPRQRNPVCALDIIMIMRFFRILPLYAAALCLVAQTPPKPPAQATPIAPSTPATPTMTGPDGVTLPLEIIQPAIIPPDRVVIQVGDVKLTSAQVGQILDAYPENQRVFANGPGRAQFIDQVVRILLLSEEGRRRKLTETEACKNQMVYSAAGILASNTDQAIKRKISGDEALLKAYYEAHKSEYEQIHARHILIRMQGSLVNLAPGQKELTDAEALAKALEIRQKILQGADFADLARTDSDDMGSSSKGGDLGFLKRGQTVPSFEDAAFALPTGQLSQPVKTPYGFHLIKVEERKPTRTFEELRPEIERTLGNEASRKFVEDLKAKTKVAIDPDFSETPKATIGPKQ